MTRKFTKYPDGYIKASLYGTPAGATYIFKLHREARGVYNFMCQEVITSNGEKKLLHNEIDVTFKLVNGAPYILSGFHIGTSDFDLEEGDSWDDYVEYYMPGITDQVLERIENNDYTYH